MSTMEPPALKSITPATDHPHPAVPAAEPADVGGPKDAGRQAVPSIPDRPSATGRAEQQTVVSWLRITAPARRSEQPTAESWCRCGHHRTATGRTGVLRLAELHTRHRDTCPLNHPTTEGQAA